MDWTQWTTLGIALLGAGLGVFNTVATHRRSVPRLQVTGFVQQGDDGRRRLRIKLVNTGHVPVTIDKVFLAGGRSQKPKAWQLWENNGRQPKLPALLQPGQQVIVVTHLDCIRRPVMDEAFTVMAKTADGRDIKASRANASQLAVESKVLAWEAEDPAKR